MYGDSETVRRHADAMGERADELRALADRLVSQVDALGWTGRAAESLRLRVADRASGLRDAAGRHERSADSLRTHAQEVERVSDRIAELERRAEALVADARTRRARVGATHGGGSAGADERADEVLLAFDAPPSGHRDWLDVDLPGLTR
ncbi:MAG: hypothetical protein CMH83_10860 [Nocardioides sp.]|nr:hypothetical protein [Nocardioides sp.]